nr:hypothetical protein CPGR_06018 [Mycolicibacterium fortuitum subsp. fortuitum DSM 46621 = ATCC 6841 = JCM 6387]CRL82843.1 hypothetical protein CPGR_06070 [Mycolicibacter nonchromogenicus]
MPVSASNHNWPNLFTSSSSSAESAQVQSAFSCTPASVSTVAALSSTVCPSEVATAPAMFAKEKPSGQIRQTSVDDSIAVAPIRPR